MNTRQWVGVGTVGMTLGLALTTAAHAADVQRGKELHDRNCIRCHAAIVGGDGTAIYTRPTRRIDSLTALNKQVRRCKNGLGVHQLKAQPQDDIQDVVAYLNQNFYQFKK